MTAKLYDALIAPTVASALKRENRLKNTTVGAARASGSGCVTAIAKRLLSCSGQQLGATPRGNLHDHAAVCRHGSRTEHEQGDFLLCARQSPRTHENATMSSVISCAGV